MSTLIYPHPGKLVTAPCKHSGIHQASTYGLLSAPLSHLLKRSTTILASIRQYGQATPIPLAVQDLEYSKTILRLKLREANSFQDWQAAAGQLDEVEGNNDWKSESASPEYDYQLVQSRLASLEDARISCDPEQMLFVIRTSLVRHLGGMGNKSLYEHSHVGTKHLIEKYIDSALATLSALLDSTRRGGGYNNRLDSRHVLEQILQTRQSFGRSALLLSGGGTFGMNHIGVVRSLLELKLLPRIVSGASAGSIVCAVLCTKTDDELPRTLDQFCYGDLNVFTGDDEQGVLGQVARFLKYGALFDISNLVRIMKNLLGDLTFQEAYNRTRRILNICVSSASVYELPRLLNYLTAPNVIIWSAVAASCSVPFVFSPAPLLAKDPRTGVPVPWNPSTQCWIDGSVDNDLPMTRLAEMFNVNHFIVSQVNPHVVPFLERDEDLSSLAGRQPSSTSNAGSQWLSKMASVARDEAMHRMQILSELGIFPNLLTKTRSVLSQRYSGDITIFPDLSYAHFPKVLQNPTTDFMLESALAGERATWPKISRIQNHCAIELALDDAVQQLRARIAFSPSQVDLRLNAIDSTSCQIGPMNARIKERYGTRQETRKGDGSNSSARRPLWSAPLGQSLALTPAAHSLRPGSRPVQNTSGKLPASSQLALRSRNSVTEPGDDGIRSSSFTSLSPSEVGTDQEGPYEINAISRLGHSADKSRPHSLFPHASQPATPLPRHTESYASSKFPDRSPSGVVFSTGSSSPTVPSTHATEAQPKSPEALDPRKQDGAVYLSPRETRTPRPHSLNTRSKDTANGRGVLTRDNASSSHHQHERNNLTAGEASRQRSWSTGIKGLRLHEQRR